MYIKYWIPSEKQNVIDTLIVGSKIKTNISYHHTVSFGVYDREVHGYVKTIYKSGKSYNFTVQQLNGRGDINIYLSTIRQYKTEKRKAYIEIESSIKYDFKTRKEIDLFNFGQNSYKIEFKQA